VGDKIVWFRPFGQRSFAITGDDHDVGVVGELDRSGGHYQHEFGLFARSIVEPDDVIVDGGAHIGVVTIMLASLCPAGRVYAFEPAAASRAHLVDNIAANGLANVVVEEAVLYDTDDGVVFAFDSMFPAGSHVDAAGTRSVSTRLDTWARDRNIERLDLLKLDVEGSEIAVLGTARELFRRFQPTTVVECNPVALKRFGHGSYRELVSLLESLGPKVGVLDPQGRFLPILSATHLDLVLADRGVVDIVGLAPRHRAGRIRSNVLAARSLLQLSRKYNRRRPAENKIVEPVIDIGTPAAATLSGGAGALVVVPVTIFNRTRWWLSSAFPYHPVHVAYRVLDAGGTIVVADGHRTVLPAPLGPGQSVALDVKVELPAVAGEYVVSITLVQEAFAWFDELNPRCSGRVSVRVA